MIRVVESRDNKIIKTVSSLHRKRGRLKTGLYFTEGVRLVNEALRFVPEDVDFLIFAESYAEKEEAFLNSLDRDGKDVYVTKDKIFRDICGTETPQGIAAAIRIPPKAVPDFREMNYVLVADGVAEPGNLGTIIRTAEAAGVECVCLMPECADIYSPKVVRASMGSLFRMRFCGGTADMLKALKESGYTIAATALKSSVPIESVSIEGRRAIVIGNEAHGVSEEVLSLSDLSVRIDMRGNVESLNAAVAAGIAMYVLRP